MNDQLQTEQIAAAWKSLDAIRGNEGIGSLGWHERIEGAMSAITITFDLSVRRSACVGAWLDAGEMVSFAFSEFCPIGREYCHCDHQGEENRRLCPFFREVETDDGWIKVRCGYVDDIDGEIDGRKE